MDAILACPSEKVNHPPHKSLDDTSFNSSFYVEASSPQDDIFCGLIGFLGAVFRDDPLSRSLVTCDLVVVRGEHFRRAVHFHAMPSLAAR